MWLSSAFPLVGRGCPQPGTCPQPPRRLWAARCAASGLASCSHQLKYCMGGTTVPNVPSRPLASQPPALIPARAPRGSWQPSRPAARGCRWSPSLCRSLGLPGLLGSGDVSCCLLHTHAVWPGRWAGRQQDCPSVSPCLGWPQGARGSPAVG